jgi:hypothetical protein
MSEQYPYLTIEGIAWCDSTHASDCDLTDALRALGLKPVCQQKSWKDAEAVAKATRDFWKKRGHDIRTVARHGPASPATCA